jgi:sterol 3beta-glucosyltransferase
MTGSGFIIPTIGTRGDVQPYIALALGLQAAGHAVTVASHPCMRTLVNSYGVEFSPMGPDIDIGAETARIRARSPHWVVGFMRVMRFSFAMLEQSHEDLLELCRSAEVVIISHTAAGSIEADQLHKPAVSVTLTPQAIPANDPDASLLNRALMKAAGAGMGLMMSRPLDRIRKRFGVPPMGSTGITSPELNLIPLSPSVSPPNPLWETRHRMTGFWFAPSPAAWEPPADLLEFLESGKPPLVISLGAMAISGEDAFEAARITLDALEQAGERAVIQGWVEPMQQLELPENVFHAGSIPHDWLLARASGIVHHGGFGTTAAGLRAGIPTLVIPHIIDQFIWGQKVAELGVGPAAIPRTRLASGKMADALGEMASAGMVERAAELGAAIRAEPDGVAEAVRLIAETL